MNAAGFETSALLPVVLGLILIACALFAGLETGVVSLNRVRLRARARRGDARAEELLRLLQRPERLLATFLVGNTLASVGGGALASAWAVSALRNETMGSVLATVGMTGALLLFSELTPKVYFRIRAEEAVPRYLWFMHVTRVLFAPVVWVTTGVLRLVARGDRSPFVTREELRQIVIEAGGRLGRREERMLHSVFDFGLTVVREVMIPIPRVASLPESATPQELRQELRRTRHTRYPLYRDRGDAVVGLVNVFDILYADPPAATLAAYRRPIHIVPDNTRIDRVLVDLQRRREAMALVVNEFGVCVGIVTVEDIVEEIMGELAEEHEAPEHPIQRLADGYLVDASLDVDDLNRELGFSFRKDRYDTVGGLVLRQLGHLPKAGERVRVDGVDFEVVAAHDYGVRRVRILGRRARGGERE
jgi:magnesium and cobalt exporter, CNNM family